MMKTRVVRPFGEPTTLFCSSALTRPATGHRARLRYRQAPTGVITLPTTTTTQPPGGPIPGALPGYLHATVWVPTPAGQRETSMDVESGRDGFELPLAAVVAERMTLAQGRANPAVSAAESTPALAATGAAAPVVLRDPAPAGALPADWPLAHLVEPWQLDEGTRHRLDGSLSAEALTPEASAQQGPSGAVLHWSAQVSSGTIEHPVVVVVTGGADLDLTGLGELFGVVIVDGGSVRLDGTTVHGAVFVSGTLDCGGTGRVVWDPAVYRWVRYRSTVRVRPVPGSRGERLIVTSTTVPPAGP